MDGGSLGLLESREILKTPRTEKDGPFRGDWAEEGVVEDRIRGALGRERHSVNTRSRSDRRRPRVRVCPCDPSKHFIYALIIYRVKSMTVSVT